MDLVLETRSPEETRSLAARLGPSIQAGDVISLQGDLGAGKTQFVKGFAVGLGVPDPAIVTSPTFVLMNSYDARIPIRHYDLYRLERVDLAALGYFDFQSGSASIVEWGERAGEALGDRLEVILEPAGGDCRRITLRPKGSRGAALQDALR